MCRGHDGPTGKRIDPGRSAFRNPVVHGVVKRAAGVALAAGLLLAGGHSGAGHSVGHYPSYYPDEIRIDAFDPAAAGEGLAEQSLHAYVGAVPSFAGPVPGHVKSVTSLSSFLLLSFNTAAERFASADDRCTAARDILAALSHERAAGFVFHPYPVTPHHADYLHHLDRIEAAKSAIGDNLPSATSVQVAANGLLAEATVRARWGAVADGADIALEVAPVDDVFAAASVQFDGWSGPPWVKEGWFHAHRLLAPSLGAMSRRAVDDTYEHLLRGDIRSLAEHTNLERQLVASLTRGCERLVVGYALKEEYFNEMYPAGVENVAYDSLGGPNSAVFIRSVKLKDYPCNGKLQLGVRDRSEAAWNPVGGFTDVKGRLIWSAVGDPAMIPFPFLIDPDGKVLNVDKMQWREDGRFAIELADRLPPGQYTVVLGIFLDGNALQAPARVLQVRVGAGSPG